MTEQQLFDAINKTAHDIGIQHWIETKHVVFAPMAMNQLVSVMWTLQFPENENTKLIREQQNNLYLKGGMIFD